MEFIPIAVDCRRCRGQGLVPGAEMPMPCPVCRGKGVVLTPEGRSILKLWKMPEGYHAKEGADG